MTIIRPFAALALFVSFNVHAIPPPPPLPKPMGFLSANVRLVVSATETCNDMICPSATEVCEFDIQVPVIPAGASDEAFAANALKDVTGKRVSCAQEFSSLQHSVPTMTAYATIDSKGLVKVITGSSLIKSQVKGTQDLSLGTTARNITVLSQASPVLTIRSYLSETVYKEDPQSPAASILTKTRSTALVALEFWGLTVHPPTP